MLLEYLAKVCDRHQWLCHAYCLMSNHYHLLVETGSPTLSKGMKYLNGSYTQYYNRKHARVGHLFQGRFKGILVEKDAYLLELSRYIVLNPVRANMVVSEEDWPWSSYRATAGLAPSPRFLMTECILSGFSENKPSAQLAYRCFVSEGQRQPAPWDCLKNQIYLGSDQFVKNMQCKMDAGQSLDDIPNVQKQSPMKPLSYYEKRYAGVRNRCMAEAYRSGHYTLKQIGDYFGVSYATVSRALKEFNV